MLDIAYTSECNIEIASTFCPYREVCSARNCGCCHVFDSVERSCKKKDADLENFYASGL